MWSPHLPTMLTHQCTCLPRLFESWIKTLAGGRIKSPHDRKENLISSRCAAALMCGKDKRSRPGRSEADWHSRVLKTSGRFGGSGVGGGSWLPDFLTSFITSVAVATSVPTGPTHFMGPQSSLEVPRKPLQQSGVNRQANELCQNKKAPPSAFLLHFSVSVGCKSLKSTLCVVTEGASTSKILCVDPRPALQVLTPPSETSL